MTTVVNVKVVNIRPRYQNLREWMDDDANVYVGRPGVVFIDKVRFPKSANSIWANPFKIGRDGDRDQVLFKFREYIINKLENDELLRNELKTLKGKTLGCWCHPEKCHGDIIAELADRA